MIPEPFAFTKSAELPPWESKPSFVDVEVQNGYGDVIDVVTVVYRFGADGWFVVTGHSGAQHCDRCRAPITPLHTMVMDLGSWDPLPFPEFNQPVESWPSIFKRVMDPLPRPRLLHRGCYAQEKQQAMDDAIQNRTTPSWWAQ